MKNHHWFSIMGHSKIVAVTGIIASVLILMLMPSLKWAAGMTLGIVLIHIAILLVLSLLVAVVLPEKFKLQVQGFFHKGKKDQEFNAGWSIGWLNGFWVISVVFLAAAVHLYLNFPALQLFAFFMFLLSVNFFIGNLTVWSAKHTRYLTLPWVKLYPGDQAHILDAGCGAGRTTVALAKIFPGAITAFDLFNSSNIAGGGNTLLEKNLKIAGIAGRVEIVQGDITQTGFPAATFDAVVSSYMIDHLGNQKLPAMAEINRILKPGGRMLMIVLTPTLSSFAILNVLSLMLTSGKQWHSLFEQARFHLAEEGEVNGGSYFLLEKPERA